MPSLRKALGRRVRHFRRHRGWTQEQLAERSGRHWTYIGGIERGERNITIEVLEGLATALAVDLPSLLVENEEGPLGDSKCSSHPLISDMNAPAIDILEAIYRGFRAQVDLKGKLAELYLYRQLQRHDENGAIGNLAWYDEDRRPDFEFDAHGKTLRVECKNIRSNEEYRQGAFRGFYKVELQKTRRGIDSQTGENTRGYTPDAFEIVAACLFNQTGQWEFLFSRTSDLLTRDDGRLLKVMQPVPKRPEANWCHSILEVLQD